MPHQKSTTGSASALTVYFDGGCPLCQREVALYQQCRGGDRVRWIDLSEHDSVMVSPDLSRSAALSRMHARRRNGELVTGARAFAALWQELDRFSWMGRLAHMPVAAPLLEIVYRVFLKLRPLLQVIARRF